MDAQQLAEASVWVDQAAAARERISDNLSALATSAWLSFAGWYDEKLVAQLAAEMAAMSSNAQDLISGSAQQYVSNVVAALRGTTVRIPPVQRPPIRNGADLLRVHTRPAEVFRRAYAQGASEEKARDDALKRAVKLAETDVQLTARSVQHEQMKALDVRHYRRVLRPELAKHGSCGLCVVASDRVYNEKDLLPIHGGCNCETLPIIGDNDPGKPLNAEDLKKLYAAAGSTSGADLKRVRVTVNEHGEYGPVLSRKGDNFRGPKDVPLDQNPARAQRMLTRVEPVLRDLERRAAEGADVAGPLAYQRDLADRLRRVVSAAA